MSNVPVIAWIALVFLTTQATMMVFAPDRAAAMMVWQYKLIGIRPAEPGKATILFFRIAGIILLAVSAIILIQTVSE